MDLKSVALISDNQPVKGKELEDFTKKMSQLTESELSDALEVNKSEILHVLNQGVPCVGCRRRYVLVKCFKFFSAIFFLVLNVYIINYSPMNILH